jgi:hypothetical protein
MGAAAMVRAQFAAYETWDRATIGPLRADDFTFRNPVDDIDRATYFERRWPAAKYDRKFDWRAANTRRQAANITIAARNIFACMAAKSRISTGILASCQARRADRVHDMDGLRRAENPHSMQ